MGKELELDGTNERWEEALVRVNCTSSLIQFKVLHKVNFTKARLR